MDPGGGESREDRDLGQVRGGVRLEEDVELLGRRIAAAVRRACPGWLSDQRDDIVQTVLTRLFASIARSEGERSFSTMYIEKAAFGAIVDEMRRARRLREDLVGDAETWDRRASPDAGAERVLASREIARGIKDCLAGLVVSRRMAVTLHLQGCGASEIARRLGWSGKKADNQIWRGMADLRRCLEAKGLKP